MVVSNVRLPDERVTRTSRNGRESLASFSCANLMDGWKLFRMDRLPSIFVLGSTCTNVLSTYLCHSHTPMLLSSSIKVVSIWVMKISNITGPSGAPTATPLCCAYILFSKVTLVSDVAVRSKIPKSFRFLHSGHCLAACLWISTVLQAWIITPTGSMVERVHELESPGLNLSVRCSLCFFARKLHDDVSSVAKARVQIYF